MCRPTSTAHCAASRCDTQRARAHTCAARRRCAVPTRVRRRPKRAYRHSSSAVARRVAEAYLVRVRVRVGGQGQGSASASASASASGEGEGEGQAYPNTLTSQVCSHATSLSPLPLPHPSRALPLPSPPLPRPRTRLPPSSRRRSSPSSSASSSTTTSSCATACARTRSRPISEISGSPIDRQGRAPPQRTSTDDRGLMTSSTPPRHPPPVCTREPSVPTYNPYMFCETCLLRE